MAPPKNAKSPTKPLDTEKETPAEATLFQSLGHPLRRQILRFVHEQGTVSYSNLRDTFKQEPGTLYFHLDQLMTPDAPLLEQRKTRQYTITALGRVAANFLSQATDRIPSTAPPSTTTPHPHLTKVTHYLGFAPLFRYLTSRRDRLILEAVIILGLLAYLFTLVPLTNIGLIPLDLLNLSLYQATLTFFASWIGITLATELIIRFRYHSPTGLTSLLAATPYAWLPQGLYALIRLLAAPFLIFFPLITFTILFASLTWSLWIYTQAITHTKHIALRKAALTTIILTNITIISIALLTILLP